MIKAAIAEASPRLEAVLGRLRQLHPKVIDLSLGRIERLLDRLGHPERRLPPIAHVAGTNGKGSVVAFLRAFLEQAGARVHVYTSPHLVHFHERIRLAGCFIGDDALAALLEDCERLNGDDPITFFEITTAAAFRAFSEIPADILLLEVGLGGRLDATNVVERPAVSVLTRISLDHTQFLGGSLAEIAWEKAGILKPGAAAVAAPQADPVVTRVFRERAAELGVPLRLHGEGWRAEPVPGGFRYEGLRHLPDLPSPALLGRHQIDNAGLALAAMEHLPVAVPDAAIRSGLAAVQWPARLQRLTYGPLVDMLPPGWELWLDGGHNDSAGEVLSLQASVWAQAEPGRPLHLIFGMLNSKAPDAFLRPLAPRARRLRAVAIPGEENSLPAEQSAALARQVGFDDAAPAADTAEALRELIAAGGPPARVLICGSLYLAGTVLAKNG